jgi:hypothetical protein
MTDHRVIRDRHPGGDRFGPGEEPHEISAGKLARVVVDVANPGRHGHQRVEVIVAANSDLHRDEA